MPSRNRNAVGWSLLVEAAPIGREWGESKGAVRGRKPREASGSGSMERQPVHRDCARENGDFDRVGADGKRGRRERQFNPSIVCDSEPLRMAVDFDLDRGWRASGLGSKSADIAC